MAGESTQPHETGRTLAAVPSEYKRAGSEWLSETIHYLAGEIHPLIRSFTHQRVEELPDETVEHTSMDYRQFVHQQEATMSLDMILSFDVDTLMGKVYEIADGLGAAQAKGMLGFVSETARALGNVVVTEQSNPWESYIKAIESLEIEFDENGENNLSLIATPEFLQSLRASPPTEEQRQRIDRVMAEKRGESRAARNNRRLS